MKKFLLISILTLSAIYAATSNAKDALKLCERNKTIDCTHCREGYKLVKDKSSCVTRCEAKKPLKKNQMATSTCVEKIYDKNCVDRYLAKLN